VQCTQRNLETATSTCRRWCPSYWRGVGAPRPGGDHRRRVGPGQARVARAQNWSRRCRPSPLHASPMVRGAPAQREFGRRIEVALERSREDIEQMTAIIPGVTTGTRRPWRGPCPGLARVASPSTRAQGYTAAQTMPVSVPGAASIERHQAHFLHLQGRWGRRRLRLPPRPSILAAAHRARRHRRSLDGLASGGRGASSAAAWAAISFSPIQAAILSPVTEQDIERTRARRPSVLFQA